MRLGDLRWPQVDPDTLLVVPIGSTEQHGPHLPLSTDTDIAVALADRFAAAYGGATVAPAIPYGSAGEHAAFPGTVSIGQRVLAELLIELVRGSHFPRTLFVNGHGGNAEPLARAASQLQTEGHDVLAWAPRVPGADAHAGRTETSLFLAAFPDRVGERAGIAGNTAPLAALLPKLRAGALREVAPNGVLGDPASGRADDGVALWTALVDDLLCAAGNRWPPSVRA